MLANHLISFGEFAAMYLSVWSNVMWDKEDQLKNFEEVVAGSGGSWMGNSTATVQSAIRSHTISCYRESSSRPWAFPFPRPRA